MNRLSSGDSLPAVQPDSATSSKRTVPSPWPWRSTSWQPPGREDVCQEAFLQVFRRLDRYDPRAASDWLFTIVSRRAFDVLKKKRRFYRFVDRATLEPRETFVAGANPDPARPLPESVLRGLTPGKGRLSASGQRRLHRAGHRRGPALLASTVRVYLFNARKKIRSSWRTTMRPADGLNFSTGRPAQALAGWLLRKHIERCPPARPTGQPR